MDPPPPPRARAAREAALNALDSIIDIIDPEEAFERLLQVPRELEGMGVVQHVVRALGVNLYRKLVELDCR